MSFLPEVAAKVVVAIKGCACQFDTLVALVACLLKILIRVLPDFHDRVEHLVATSAHRHLHLLL